MVPKPVAGAVPDRPQVSSESGDDLTLATTIAQTVQGVPGVRALSAGSFATVATYGPGGRVTGVVLRRTQTDTLTIEVRLVACQEMMRHMPHPPSLTLPEAPLLLDLAERVRTSVQQMVAPLPLSQPATVDIVIDDLR